MAKYYYSDKDGTEHCTTTETSTMTVECGAQYMDVLEHGGDCTVSDCNRFTKRTLSIAALGTGR